MNHNQNSSKRNRQIDEFLRKREARLYSHLGRLYQAMEYAQAAPVRKPDNSEVVEGSCFVVGSASNGLYRQELKRIEALRQAVFGRDARIFGAWVLAIICIYYGWYSLALDLLGLVGVLFYLKFVRAAKAPCPNCQEPFGSSQSLPTKLGGKVCQNCGLSIAAMR